MASKNGNKKGNNDGVMGLFGYRGGGDKPRKKQVITYDKEGNVLGDDGYAMTKTRRRMHRIFDAWFIYIFVMVLGALVLMLLGYQQGAQYTDWNLVQTGGNQINGWDAALLLRMDALLCLYSAVFAALINIFGFRWFYDRKSIGIAYGMLFALGAVSIGYFVFSIVYVGAPEPISLINLSFILITILSMRAVIVERPYLRKPKVGRREVK